MIMIYFCLDAASRPNGAIAQTWALAKVDRGSATQVRQPKRGSAVAAVNRP